ncbi:hypothetical protein [Caballeronia sp. KNU42]
MPLNYRVISEVITFFNNDGGFVNNAIALDIRTGRATVPITLFIEGAISLFGIGRISLQPKENVIEKNVSACLSAR